MITPNDQRLTAYVLGELDEADRQTLRAAIAESPELQQAVHELEQTCALLKTSFASELPAGAPESLPQPSKAAMAAKETTPLPARRRFKGIAWFLAAALLLGVFGTSFWLSNGEYRNWRELAQRATTDGDESPDNLSEQYESAIVRKHQDESAVLDALASVLASAGDDNGASTPLRGNSIVSDMATQPAYASPALDGESARPLQLSANSVPATVQTAQVPETTGTTDQPSRGPPASHFAIAVPQSATNPASQRSSGGGADGGVSPGGGGAQTPPALVRLQIPSGEGEIESKENGKSNHLFGVVGGVGEEEKRAGLGTTFQDSFESVLNKSDRGGDRYDSIIENAFLSPRESPLSTFSIDVDTASYSKVRSYLKNYQQLPPPGAVRIEELVNYFPYSYAPPVDNTPFAAHQSVVACPWNPAHKLVRVALKGREIPQEKRPASNLVFLLDVSGSMDESNKLPLVKRGIQMLINQLGENDRVAMVVYAGAAGLVLDSTTGDQKSTLLGALDRLSAGGSTNGGDGIRLAYQLAQDHFITGGINRVILCTDGDFNVGTTSTDELVGLIEEKAKGNVFLTVLGFGMGNLNDAMLEQISNRGNGTYAFIDTDHEAHKVMVEQLSGTLQTIAKDVKIQIEFNPARVAAYRLIGYENRILAAEDFNNDRKDAGEIGAGHTVTALYEIVPAGGDLPGATQQVDDLKYQAQPEAAPVADNGELLTLKLRYKQPEGSTSLLLTFPLVDGDRPFAEADHDFQFAASVAAFGMKLRGSQHAGSITWPAILEIAQSACGADEGGYRTEFIELVRLASQVQR